MPSENSRPKTHVVMKEKEHVPDGDDLGEEAEEPGPAGGEPGQVRLFLEQPQPLRPCGVHQDEHEQCGDEARSRHGDEGQQRHLRASRLERLRGQGSP